MRRGAAGLRTEASCAPRTVAGSLRPAALLRLALLLPLCALLLSACTRPGTAERYAALENWYLDNGRLRLDRDPPDAPIDRETLARDFEIVAFNSEFAPGDRLVAERTPVPLTRWSGEITWRAVGSGVGARDLGELLSLTQRISEATRLRFSFAAEGLPRILVMILDAQERARFAELTGAKSALPTPVMQAWAEDERYPCVGVLLEQRRTGPQEGRRGAFVLIKAETQGLLRLACLHEEFTQTLGLINDGAEVRPSIFNDDQEFAALTRHDELLLRILYDPRLRVGMTAEEGMPIVRRIVSEMKLPGEAER